MLRAGGSWQLQLKTLDAMKGLPQPIIATELRLLADLCDVYLQIVPNFACIAFSLDRVLRKKESTNFEMLQEYALEPLDTPTKKPKTLPMLSLPNLDLPHNLKTDACYWRIGVVLTQT